MKGTLLERNDLMALFEFNKEILEKCSLQTPFYQEKYLLTEWLFQLKNSKSTSCRLKYTYHGLALGKQIGQHGTAGLQKKS